MNPFRWILNLFKCQHFDTYRERRGKHSVLHAVCADCDTDLGPLVTRTKKEQAKVRATSRVLGHTSVARPATPRKKVAPFGTGRG